MAMSDLRRDTMIGAFVILGLGLLGWLLVIFGEAPSWLGGAEKELKIMVHDLQGTSQGMPVNMNGILVGRVGRMEFVDITQPHKGVYVIALIKKHYIVPAGSTARIYPAALGVGKGHIDIIVPDSIALQPVPSGETILGDMASPFGDVVSETMLDSLEHTIQQIGRFAEKLTPAAQDLHKILETRTVADVDRSGEDAATLTANFSTIIERFDRSLMAFNDVFADPAFKTNMVASVAHFKDMTSNGAVALAELRRAITELRADLDRMARQAETGLNNLNRRIDAVADDLHPALEHLAKTAENLRAATQALAEQDGTAGLMLRDPRLYESALLTMERLTELIDTLRRVTDRWEQQNYIGIKAYDTPLGNVRVNKQLPAGPSP